jgi:HPt (histidine-containing phosphotransfer) domain-containing protein
MPSRRLGTSQDPERAFRLRAARDCSRIVRLAQRLRQSADWRRVAKPLRALEELAHALAGAGGMFGFLPVSAAAAKVERLAERWRLDPPKTFTTWRIALLAKATGALVDALQAVNEPE